MMDNRRRVEIIQRAIRQAKTHARNRRWYMRADFCTAERLLDQALHIIERDEVQRLAHDAPSVVKPKP